MKRALFGVAGFPVNFFESKMGKNRDNIFAWISSLGLDVLELQCTYGIKMSEEQALRYRKLASDYNITMTMHAPYYISLASQNKDVVERSKMELKKAFDLAKLLNVKRIIFSPGGGYGKEEDRRNGLENLIKALNDIKKDIDLEDIKFILKLAVR